MNWPFRLAQWIVALHHARQRVPWLGLVRAVLSGPVPRAVWRRRLRHGCFQCPLFNRERLTCRGVPKPVRHLGCDCYLPFSALTAAPYSADRQGPHGAMEPVAGCWGRIRFGGDFGWGAHVWPSRRAKWWAVACFLAGRR